MALVYFVYAYVSVTNIYTQQRFKRDIGYKGNASLSVVAAKSSDADSHVDQGLADGPGSGTCPDAVNHVADVPVGSLDPQHNSLTSGSAQGMA